MTDFPQIVGLVRVTNPLSRKRKPRLVRYDSIWPDSFHQSWSYFHLTIIATENTTDFPQIVGLVRVTNPLSRKPKPRLCEIWFHLARYIHQSWSYFHLTIIATENMTDFPQIVGLVRVTNPLSRKPKPRLCEIWFHLARYIHHSWSYFHLTIIATENMTDFPQIVGLVRVTNPLSRKPKPRLVRYDSIWPDISIRVGGNCLSLFCVPLFSSPSDLRPCPSFIPRHRG